MRANWSVVCCSTHSIRTGSRRSARTSTRSSASSPKRVGVPHAVALSSGTAALHLALHDPRHRPRATRSLTSTLTFAATANAITYVGARPVFVDVRPRPGTSTRTCSRRSSQRARRRGRQAAAVLTVDLYGQCADYARIAAICERYGVPLIEDAAEALGATYGRRQAGAFGECAAFSFNGNKIITTSGGGMLVSHRRDIVERARHLSTQARDPAPHYQHSEIGYNYRSATCLRPSDAASSRRCPTSSSGGGRTTSGIGAA